MEGVFENALFILYIFMLFQRCRWGRGEAPLYHLLLSITLFLSVCRSKASKIGVPKMYIVEMTGGQCREKAWSIRHVSTQKGEGGEAEKGLGVYLIPQLEEFEAFSLGQVVFSSVFFSKDL